MQTNAGSYALQDSFPGADATVVAKLRSDGLIILGKASLSELSMFRSSHWPHAWNPVLGQTYGAYCRRQCPGGSSGGSAVATDLGLAWATLGTETDGSIIIPSERNNIVGIKPTVGLGSRYLVVPISERQDSVGPMARSVKDAARLLEVIVGPDPHDRYTLEAPATARRGCYVAACKLSGLQGRRIGIATNVAEAYHHDAPYARRAFAEAISVMRQAGAVIVKDSNFVAYAEWKQRNFNPVTRADFATNFPQYMGRLACNANGIESVQGLRDFVRHLPREEYPAIGTQTWDYIVESALDQTSPEFGQLVADNLRLGGEGGILGALERDRLDAVVLPAAVASFMPALVGTPVVTVPLGATPEGTEPVKEGVGDALETAPGIPFGIGLLGAKWSEEALIGMAYALEQRLGVRKRLKRHIEPSVDLGDVLAT
ncbi:hypothetical protein CDD82_634 [Ophiocordyceps australis]|uniref:Amidase domain-containing protein n=1 Tax=Ophiocordyceps australis TaxID=1399860 RepID=A0A2C5YMT4_9HYPO|nr:hypothetical protein CDD82_634 [Ophiocordyceps australis]